MTARQADYVSEVRAAAAQIVEGLETLLAAQAEWNALDYGNTLTDLDGAHAGLTKANVGSAVFDTANALNTLMAAGHGTNLYTVRS